MKKKGKARRKAGKSRTSNPLPKGAKSVRVANPAPEKKMAKAKKRKKSGKKSSKKRTGNPSSKARKRSKKRRAGNPASAAPPRTRKGGRRRRNPSSSRRESGGTRWPGQMGAAAGGGLLVAGMEIGAEYIPASPVVTAMAGTVGAMLGTAALAMVSRSARDGATGAIAAKTVRDVRMIALTTPAKKKDTTTPKTGLRGYGALSRPAPNQLPQGRSQFVTGQMPGRVTAR